MILFNWFSKPIQITIYYFVYLSIIDRIWIKPVIIYQIIIFGFVIIGIFVIKKWTKVVNDLLKQPVNPERFLTIVKIRKSLDKKVPPITYSIVMLASLFIVMTLEYPIWGTIYSFTNAIFIINYLNLIGKWKDLFELYQLDKVEITKIDR